ncbi:daptide biosynthesis intramembrane metalloprotease, partial [Streptomyces sp. URMC 123]
AQVVVHPPGHPDQPWTVQQDSGQYFRIGEDAARLLCALDGRRTAGQLAADLGGGWTPAAVEQTLAAFARHGWLETSRAPAPRRRPRRLVYRRPLTVQWCLFDPSRLLERARPALAWLATPWAPAAALTGLLLTILTLVAHHAQAGHLLRHPPSGAVVVAAALLGLFSGVLHEFGHAAMLVAHGGRPRRFGVMLFYLLPALFCDVSDGWRL